MGATGRQVLVVIVGLVAVATTVTVVGAVAHPGDDARGDRVAVGDGGPVGAAVAGHDDMGDPPGRLPVGEGAVASGYDTPAVDLGATVSLGDAEYRGGFEAYRAREGVEAATSDAERRAAIRVAIDRARNRTETLREREAAAVRAYDRGEIGTDELLRRIALLDAEAAALQVAMTDIQNRGRDVIGFSLSQDLVTVNGDLQSFRTPVRASVGEALGGGGRAGAVHARATGDGLVVEAIDDGVYLRDAVRMDNYAPGEGPELNATRALGRLEELYADTFPVPGSPSLDSIGARLYAIEFTHERGRVSLYLDTTTGDRYREFQTLQLDRLATTPVTTVVGNRTEVRVNRTARDNPYEVTVTDAATGVPLDASVSVDGTPVGDTGDDGRAWVLGTTGEFEVTVETDRETVNATVPG